jgi:hypothetical protein
VAVRQRQELLAGCVVFVVSSAALIVGAWRVSGACAQTRRDHTRSRRLDDRVIAIVAPVSFEVGDATLTAAAPLQDGDERVAVRAPRPGEGLPVREITTVMTGAAVRSVSMVESQ